MKHFLVLTAVLFCMVHVRAQSDIVIGSTQQTSGAYPVNSLARYSAWMGIYDWNEIAQAGAVTHLHFYNTSVYGEGPVYQVKIYARTSGENTFSGSEWDVTEFSQVYFGNIEGIDAIGWNEIVLDEPITLAANEHLHLAIEYGYQPRGFDLSWACHTISGPGKNRYAASDTEFPLGLHEDNNRPSLKLTIDGFTVDAGPDVLKCISKSTPIGGTPAIGGYTSGVNYSWSPGTTLDNVQLMNPLSSSTVNTTYTLQGQRNNVVKSDAMTLTVFGEAPTVSTRTDLDVYADAAAFYDSETKGDYANNENYTVRFFPCSGNRKISITFVEFVLDASAHSDDELLIYNGPDADPSELIGVYKGSTGPSSTITSSDLSTGALTVVFHSNGSGTAPGWAADVSSSAVVSCDTLGSQASISSSAGCNSGTALLNVTIPADEGNFEVWQRKIGSRNWEDITGSSASYQEFVNTTTYYRAKISHAHCPVRYSTTLTYQTGNNYYVNDDSTTNDKWCTVPGFIEHDGLSPDQPQSSLYSIVDAYDLGPCDTVFIDAGTHSFAQITLTPDDSGDDVSFVVINGAGSALTKIVTEPGYKNFELFDAKSIVISDMALEAAEDVNVSMEGTMNVHVTRCYLHNQNQTNVYISHPKVDESYSELSELFIYNSGDAKPCIVMDAANLTQVHNVLLHGGSSGIFMNATNDCYFHSNMISGSVFGIEVGPESTKNRLYSSSFNNGESCLSFFDGTSMEGWAILNNIFSSDKFCVFGKKALDGTFAVMNNNLFNYGDALAEVDGKVFPDLLDWQKSGIREAADGLDKSSLVDDPDFFDIENGLLFINEASPAIGKGIVIEGISTDFSRSAIRKPYSIGASRPIRTPEPQPYCELSQKPNGAIYNFKREIIRFKYLQEYATPSGGTTLQYKIYNEEHEVVYQTGSIATWDETVNYGTNYVSWQAPPCGGLMKGGVNLLEVTNEKGEVWYMWFTVSMTYYVGSNGYAMIEYRPCMFEMRDLSGVMFTAN